jgi:plastocyanin
MVVARWRGIYVLGMGLLALACGDGTSPPGPPTQLVKSGGDAQSWFFNNPLPAPYSVTVRDANNRGVPGVSVDWAMTTGGGSFSSDPSTTNASGVATTLHTLGTATTYVVMGNVSGLATVTFTASASAPPTAVGVSVNNNFFTPRDTAVQTGGTVTWTQTGTGHNVTFTGGPTPLPANIPDATLVTGTAGDRTRTLTAVGTYTYTCTNHLNMNGSVTVVN